MTLSDAEITALAEKYSSVRVLCAGDVMLDRFIYGDVTRISPEAPIPVFSVREERSMLGGAGNVARNIAALGAGQSFITVVGQDKAASDFFGYGVSATLHGLRSVLMKKKRRAASRWITVLAASLRLVNNCA